MTDSAQYVCRDCSARLRADVTFSVWEGNSEYTEVVSCPICCRANAVEEANGDNE